MTRITNKHTSAEHSIRIIRSFEEVEEIRSFWEQQQWHPYTDIQYYLKFAEVHEGFIRPHVMVLSRGGQPETLVIGWIQKKRFNWKFGYKTVYKPQARCLFVEYAGILGANNESNCSALIEEIQNCLKRGEADFAYFKFIKHDSAIFSLTKEKPSFLCRDYFPYINPHWTLSLPGTYDEFYKSRTKKMKKTMRLNANRLKKEFGDNIHVKCYQLKDDVDRAIDDIETIAKKTFQRGLGVGFFDTPEGRTEWMFAAENDWLRVYVLYLNDKPCAFFTGYKYANIYHPEATGFDRDYQYYSPGMYLMMRIIEDFCADKDVDIIDFGFGDADYKRLYCDQKWNDAGVYLFAPTLNGIRLNTTRSLIAFCSHSAEKILNHFKMVRWVKKKWRQQVLPT